MATLYSDTFESGTIGGAWTQTTSGTGTIAANGGSAKNGSWGVQSLTNASGNVSDQARISQGFTEPASNIICAEFWARWTSFVSFGFGSATAKGIVRIGNDTTTGANTDATARALGVVVVGTQTVQASYRSKSGSDALFGSTLNMGTSWYKFRITIDKTGANPIATVSHAADGVNFTQLATVTDSTSGTGGLGSTINLGSFGITHMNAFEPCQYTLDVDDVFVYDAVPVGGVSAVAVRDRGVLRGVMRGVPA